MDRKEPSFRERGARGSLGAGVGFSTAGCWDFPDGAAGGSSARTGAGCSTAGCWDVFDRTTDGGSDGRTGVGCSTADCWDFRDDHQLAGDDQGAFCSTGSSMLSSEAVDVSRSARSPWEDESSTGDTPL